MLNVTFFSFAMVSHAGPTFRLALLRSDGILVPIANYVNGNWNNPWVKIEDLEKTRLNQLERLEDIPKSWLGAIQSLEHRWYLIDSAGRFGHINLIKPVLFESHCESSWGILTDYPPKKNEYAHTPKVAIALDTKQQVFVAVNKSETKTKNLKFYSLIEHAFQKLEDEEIEKALQDPFKRGFLLLTGHPTNKEERKTIRVSITAFYQIHLSSRSEKIYYVEASKSYQKPKSDSDYLCEGISFLRSYIVEDAKGLLSIMGNNLDITDCDMKESFRCIPLGVIEIGEKYYLVTENNYYESEDYNIYQIEGRTLRKILEIYGGGC